MSVTMTANGLLVAGREVPVYSGTVHYWRLERAEWATILDQVVALGFNMIETYIPWAIHEIAPGVYDWGERDCRKDLVGFMRACEERNLWLLVRPGPLINAELTDFGFPEWVLLDPEVQAHNALGTLHIDEAFGLHPPRPWPVPSYASEKFYDYVGGWFDAVCPIIAQHLAPAGCVVAVQSDNETCYMFNDQPYATDYSPASLALYRRFLAAQYGDIAALNSAYSASYADFAAVEPPRDCEVETRADLPRHIDWVRFKEYGITYPVARVAAMLRERGMGEVPIFHDVAYQQTTPVDVTALEDEPDVDWVGINMYRNKEDYGKVLTQIRYLVGSTKLSFVPEFGCGIWSHHPVTPTPAEEEIVTLAALMHGLKAFNLYMLVERERWQGCPITRHGELRPADAALYSRLNAFLKHYRLWEMARDDDVLVLRNFDLARYHALATTAHYAHVDLLGLPDELFELEPDLGLKWDAHREADERNPASWLGTLYGTLACRSTDYNIADSHASTATLARYSTIFAHSTDFMDLAAQQRLIDAASAGATVIIGPGLPYCDPTMQQAGPLAGLLDAPGEVALGTGKLVWATTEDLAATVAKYVAAPEYSCADQAIDLAVLRGAEHTLLYAANVSAEGREAKLNFAGRRVLRSAWGAEEMLSGSGELAIRLDPWEVRIWEVAND